MIFNSFDSLYSSAQIFNELFKQLALRIVMQLRLRAAGPLHQHADVVEKLLAVQRRLCTNILLPVSVELVDDVLAFLGEIGIRQLAEAGSKVGVLSAEAAAEHSARFVRLHSAMTDVTLALVQHRYFHVVDRVAQFGGIVKDLLHAVAFFRASVVGKVGGTTVAQTTAATAAVAATTAPTIAPLDKADVGRLAELSHRLEKYVTSKHSLIFAHFLIQFVFTFAQHCQVVRQAREGREAHSAVFAALHNSAARLRRASDHQ